MVRGNTLAPFPYEYGNGSIARTLLFQEKNISPRGEVNNNLKLFLDNNNSNMISIGCVKIRGHMEKYRRLGIKLTPQRLAILEYLNGNTDHPSAEDIYRTVSKKYPTMSFATVYNTLGTLKTAGASARTHNRPEQEAV